MKTFQDYAALGYGPCLLPIIPPNAEPSKHSKNPAALLKKRGKIPGKRAGDGWVGFAQWEGHRASDDDLERWQKWRRYGGAGIGLQAADYPALDVDILDPALASAVVALILRKLGVAPIRTGRPPKALIPCRLGGSGPFAKRRLSFALNGERHALELLGVGQQYLLEGVHPDTGKPYSWAPLDLPQVAELPELTPARADAIFEEVRAAVALFGGELAGETRAFVGGGPAAEQNTLLAPSLEAVADALASVPNDVDYDVWIKVCCAVKAATDESEEGRELFADWSSQWSQNEDGVADQKWGSLRAPYRVGWPWLQDWASREGDFNSAHYDFAPVTDTPPNSDSYILIAQTIPDELCIFDEPHITDPPPSEDIFERFVWVAGLERAFDTATKRTLTRTQFNIANNHVGDPAEQKHCAWAQWARSKERLQRADGVTYRPGGPLFIDESWGRCVNTWSPSSLKAKEVPHDQIQIIDPWLQHVGYLFPDEKERETLLDWLAFLLQRPGEKPRWQMLLGSPREGVGKDLMLQPIIAALGPQNVSTITAKQLVSQYTDWCENARLVVVEEMEHFGKRELANSLRPYLAAPPDVVPISKKYAPLYSVPNIFGVLFLTNNENALPLPKGDRRCMILWSEAVPRDAGYYAQLVDWYDKGGRELVAGWLLSRDLSTHDQRHVAPMTAQKDVMQRVALSPLEDWIAEGIDEESGPFAQDIIEVGDLLKQVPARVRWEQGTEARLASFLRRAGCRPLERVRFANPLPSTGRTRGRLYTVRRHEMYESIGPDKAAELFLKHYAVDPFAVMEVG